MCWCNSLCSTRSELEMVSDASALCDVEKLTHLSTPEGEFSDLFSDVPGMFTTC